MNDGTNVTLAGGTTSITSAIIHDYNGNNSGTNGNNNNGVGFTGRRFSTMDIYGGGFGDDYLMSSYYEVFLYFIYIYIIYNYTNYFS